MPISPYRAEAGANLPDEIFVELVSLIFSSARLICAFIVIMAVGGQVAYSRTGDPLILALTIGVAVVCLGRLCLEAAFRRATAKQPLTRTSARRWQRRYAVGGWSCSLATSSMAVWAVYVHDLMALLILSGVGFVYLTGMVVHVAVRPRIASVQLALGVLPTVGACLLTGDRFLMAYAGVLLAYYLAGERMIVYLYRLIIDRVMSRHQLFELAHYDQLTGLANRSYLYNHLAATMAADTGRGGRIGVLCLDLDGFKPVNDTHGHKAGDVLLGAVARRLEACLDGEEFVGRIGGDEFVVICRSAADRPSILARKIIEGLSRSFEIGGNTISIGVSIGISHCMGEEDTAGRVLDRADIALYRAKRQGRGRMAFHETLPEAVAAGTISDQAEGEASRPVALAS